MDVNAIAKRRHKIQELRLREDVDRAFAEEKEVVRSSDTAIAVNFLMKWLGYWLPLAAFLDFYKNRTGLEFTLFWAVLGVLLVVISKMRKVKLKWTHARKIVAARKKNHEEQLKWQHKVLTGALSNQSRFNQRLDAKIRERRSENLSMALESVERNAK